MSTTRPLPRRAWLPCLALLWSAACADAADAGDSAEPQVAVAVQAVVGGEATDPCDWPSTVQVNDCTGTLIHPRVVTTAGHCLSAPSSTATVTFTAGNDFGGSFTLLGECTRGGGASAAATNRDWGYCVIPQDARVAQLPYTPPLVGCEADRYLNLGSRAWVVGFGTTGSSGQGAGIKREVEVVINELRDGVIDVGDSEVGACHGDSGGPIYMKLGDATHDWGWRVFGSTSSSSSRCDCACSTVYVNIANHVAAIEQNEGIDVTPCTNADGAWEPSAACTAFQSTPREGTGTYPACSVAVTSGPIETCTVPVLGAGSDESDGGSSEEHPGGSADENDGGSSDDAPASSDESSGEAGTARAGSGGVGGATAGSRAAGGSTAAGGSGGASGVAAPGVGGRAVVAAIKRTAEGGCQVSRAGSRARSASSGASAYALLLFACALAGAGTRLRTARRAARSPCE